MIYLFILSVTLLAFVLYYKKMLKIEVEKNQKLLLRLERIKTKTTTAAADPDAEVKKIMKQTGLTYDIALQIHNGNGNIKVKTSNNKIKKPTRAKY